MRGRGCRHHSVPELGAEVVVQEDVPPSHQTHGREGEKDSLESVGKRRCSLLTFL